MRRIRTGIVCGLLAAGVGCSSQYVYRPEENATATVNGRVAAIYQVPPEAPRGDVRVASFGVAKLTRNNIPETRVFHIRMIVTNNSDQAWFVDTRAQSASIRGVGQVAPAYASSDQGGLPRVPVYAGQKRTIDLFFPLAPGLEKASRIPQVDLMWRVETPNRLVVERTPFERLRIEPLYASSYWGYPWGGGWGPYSWYDPIWGPGVVGPPAWYW